MYIKRKRQAHRLLQQIDTFQVELFNAKLKLLEIQQAEANGNRKSAKRRLWAKSWLLRRPLYGQYERLLRELTAEDIAGYKNFLRMNPEMFHDLLARVGPKIEKQDTFWRTALEPGLKLAITLRYIATGNSYRSLQYGFRVSFSTISLLIPDVCEAIIEEYADEVLSCPVTADGWKPISVQL